MPLFKLDKIKKAIQASTTTSNQIPLQRVKSSELLDFLFLGEYFESPHETGFNEEKLQKFNKEAGHVLIKFFWGNVLQFISQEYLKDCSLVCSELNVPFIRFYFESDQGWVVVFFCEAYEITCSYLLKNNSSLPSSELNQARTRLDETQLKLVFSQLHGFTLNSVPILLPYTKDGIRMSDPFDISRLVLKYIESFIATTDRCLLPEDKSFIKIFDLATPTWWQKISPNILPEPFNWFTGLLPAGFAGARELPQSQIELSPTCSCIQIKSGSPPDLSITIYLPTRFSKFRYGAFELIDEVLAVVYEERTLRSEIESRKEQQITQTEIIQTKWVLFKNTKSGFWEEIEQSDPELNQVYQVLDVLSI